MRRANGRQGRQAGPSRHLFHAAGLRTVFSGPRAVTPLLRADQLREGVERLARAVTAHYGTQPLTIVGVLNGSIVLLADLIRYLDMPLRVGLLQARSYRAWATRPGEL